MNEKKPVAFRRIAAGTVLAVSQAAGATDEALLQVLLSNRLITQRQYDAIVTAERATAARPAAASREPPLPRQGEGLLDVLLANGVISQQQFAALQVRAADEQAKRQEAEEAKVTLKDGLKFKSASGDFSAQIGAYAQLDTAFYGDQGDTDFANGTELRRARLSMSGTVFRDWDYKLEADFAGTTQASGTTNDVTITDAYLRYNGLKPVAITAGSFKVPFGLEAVGSAKYITFMERGLPFAFLNLRSLGAMASTGGDNWTGAVGLFGEAVTTQNVDDEGWGPAARLTWAPVWKKDRVLHLGVGGQYRVPGDNASGSLRERVRFRSKPESNVISDNLTQCGSPTDAGCDAFPAGQGRSSGRLVDTGNISGDVSHYTLGGLEAAAVYGPFSLQGEYTRADVDRDTGDNLSFDGYYVYGSWFLTGESRNYRADKGVFDALQPKQNLSLRGGGWGAWEIGIRFSSIDFNDGNIEGGQEDNLTVGLNWYPNPFVRLMANYVNVLEVDGGARDGEDIDVIQVRAQVAY